MQGSREATLSSHTSLLICGSPWGHGRNWLFGAHTAPGRSEHSSKGKASSAALALLCEVRRQQRETEVSFMCPHGFWSGHALPHVTPSLPSH